MAVFLIPCIAGCAKAQPELTASLHGQARHRAIGSAEGSLRLEMIRWASTMRAFAVRLMAGWPLA